MSLGKYIVPVTFAGGLDQKTPAKLTAMGKFLVLENCVRRKVGGVQKRFGFTALSTGISGTTDNITGGRRLENFNEDLLLFDDNEFYSYASAADEWISRGDISSVLVDSDPIVRNGELQGVPDIAHSAGFTISAWEDSRGGVRMSLIDDATGAATLYDYEVSATGTFPRVVALNDSFIVAYQDGGDYITRLVRKSDPSVLEGPVTVAGDMADAPHDLEVATSNYLLFAYNNTSNGISIGYLNQDGDNPGAGEGMPTPVTINSATALGTDAITLVPDQANDRFYVLYYDSATDTDVKVTAYSYDLLVTATDSLDTVADIRNITGCIRSDSSVRVFYERSAASTYNHIVYTTTFTYDGNATFTPGTPAVFKRSVGLAAKAIAVGDVEYVTVAYESALQPTYFTVRSDGQIVTRMLSLVAGGLTRDAATSPALTPGLSRTALDSSGKYSMALIVRNRLQAAADGTILATNRNVQRLSLAFEASSFDMDTLGENLHVAGGMVQSYDGVSATEHGFHLFPENITDASAGGGSLTAGDYSYRVVYEWIDARGQIHQSAPSVTQTQAATLNQQINLTIPTLRLTSKDTPRAPVKIVVYVAAKGLATVYYRHGTVNNNPAVDTVSYSIATEAVLTNEILYTTGGVYENIAPPACKVIHKHKNRLFIAGLEDGNEVAFSKEHVKGEGVAFNADLLKVRVDPTGGDVLTLGTLDDKIVFFKKDRTFFLVGDGPLDTGAQNDFSTPQAISGDIGCSTPQSVASTPKGLMFKSDKGIYLLTRSLQFQYVGAPVEDFNDLTVTSATVVEDQDEVRFTTSDGPTLVYNYVFDQWSTFSNYAAVSATNALGTYIHLTASGVANREVVDQFDDNGSRIQMAIETSWIALSGIQGYYRIYRFAVLGDFLSHHITRCKLAYDYEDVYNETVYFNTSSGLQQTIFGDDAIFGQETPLGGNGSTVYQFRCKPARQKCQSFKLRIEDLDTIEATFGACFTLLTLTLEVGRKVGITKMGASKTVGSG